MSLALSTFTVLCYHPHCLYPKLVIIPNIISVLLNTSSPFSLPQPLATSILLSVPVNLPILGTSCKWSQTVLSCCVWLMSLSIVFSRCTHIAAYIKTSFLFMAEEYSVVWVDHILFIRSSVQRHLGCFCETFGSMITVAMNLGAHIC